jgi:hypothetical protein
VPAEPVAGKDLGQLRKDLPPDRNNTDSRLLKHRPGMPVAADVGKPCSGFLAVSEIERRQRYQALEDGFDCNRFLELAKFVDSLLQPLGDQKVVEFDDVAAVGFCQKRRREAAGRKSCD